MEPQSRMLPWKRMALEGCVIVASILLAFAIDAWWDKRKDDIASVEQLDRVAAELRLNSNMVSSRIEILQGAVDGTYELISWMGPQPDAVETAAFVAQLNVVTDIGTFSLIRRAANDYLDDGRQTTPGTAEVRHYLSEWSYYGDRLEDQYELLRTQHWTLNNYLSMKAATPTLEIFESRLARHLETGFPFNQAAMLADPVFESLLARYLLRLEIVVSRAQDLQDRQARMLELVDAAMHE